MELGVDRIGRPVVDAIVDHNDDRIARRTGRKPLAGKPGGDTRAQTALVPFPVQVPGQNLALPLIVELRLDVGRDVDDGVHVGDGLQLRPLDRQSNIDVPTAEDFPRAAKDCDANACTRATSLFLCARAEELYRDLHQVLVFPKALSSIGDSA